MTTNFYVGPPPQPAYLGKDTDGNQVYQPNPQFWQWINLMWKWSTNFGNNATASIGGFQLGSDYIRDVANSFGLASTVTGGDDVRFWAGATYANRGTAPFRVTEAGVMTATSGTFSGSITGASGTFAGDITTTGHVAATGSYTSGAYTGSIVGTNANSGEIGVLGYATYVGNYGTGVKGVSSANTALGAGVEGVGLGAGSVGGSFSGVAAAVAAYGKIVGATSSSDIEINTNKFTVAASTGNTVIAGTCTVAGSSVLVSGGALGTPSSGTLTNCTFPTLNQNTTGSAATLTTARNIGGVSFNGSASIDPTQGKYAGDSSLFAIAGSPATTCYALGSPGGVSSGTRAMTVTNIPDAAASTTMFYLKVYSGSQWLYIPYFA